VSYKSGSGFALQISMIRMMLEKESQLSSLVDNLSTSVLVLNPQLVVEYMNPAAEVLFAASSRQSTGQSVKDLLPAEPAFIERIRQVLTNGQGFTQHEMTLVLTGDKRITVDCTVNLEESSQQQRLLVEMKQVDQHLRVSREERLLAQNVATRALVRGFAHEVKNPLGGLRGAAQLLEAELPDESLKEYTQIIIGEADRLQKLVDGMLGPNSLPNMTILNIHEVLERVRSLVLAEVPEGVLLKRNYDISIPEFLADKDQLIQSVLNIVRNAIQATEGKGTIELKTRIERQLTIGSIRHRHVMRLDITDNGVGIPEEMQQRIFYPMVTSRAEGTGVGLSIAQSLISRHGGLIECTSEPGETRFTILLPIETESKENA